MAIAISSLWTGSRSYTSVNSHSTDIISAWRFSGIVLFVHKRDIRYSVHTSDFQAAGTTISPFNPILNMVAREQPDVASGCISGCQLKYFSLLINGLLCISIIFMQPPYGDHHQCIDWCEQVHSDINQGLAFLCC